APLNGSARLAAARHQPGGLAAFPGGSEAAPKRTGPETRDAMAIGPNNRGRLSPRGRDELEHPFCGDEDPPLKGSPGTVVCTKDLHPAAEWHLNEETGWMWQSRTWDTSGSAEQA